MSRGSIGSALEARRPASTARAKARAMRDGIAGLGDGGVEQDRVVAQLHRRVAWEGRPIPASTTRARRGSGRAGCAGRRGWRGRGRSRSARPRASAPGSRRRAGARPRSGPRWCRGTPRSRPRTRMRAASTSSKGSGCSVSWLPITSSLIQGVPNSSRAIWAVVTASRTQWQPAVLGRTRTPSSRMIDQKPSPARLPPISRRSETVATSAPAAPTASGEDRRRGILRRAEHQARGRSGSRRPPAWLSLPAAVPAPRPGRPPAARRSAVGRRARSCR